MYFIASVFRHNGAREGRHLSPGNVVKCFLCCKCCLKSSYRRSIYALFWENFVSFWGFAPRPPPGFSYCTTLRTSVLQTPSLPTPEKNPAGTHASGLISRILWPFLWLNYKKIECIQLSKTRVHLLHRLGIWNWREACSGGPAWRDSASVDIPVMTTDWVEFIVSAAERFSFEVRLVRLIVTLSCVTCWLRLIKPHLHFQPRAAPRCDMLFSNQTCLDFPQRSALQPAYVV